MANGVEASKETIELVPSRAKKVKKARKQIPSLKDMKIFNLFNHFRSLCLLHLIPQIQEQIVDIPSIAHISSKMKKLLLAIQRTAPTRTNLRRSKNRLGILCFPFHLSSLIYF